jgi:hypothetical protein
VRAVRVSEYSGKHRKTADPAKLAEVSTALAGMADQIEVLRDGEEARR